MNCPFCDPDPCICNNIKGGKIMGKIMVEFIKKSGRFRRVIGEIVSPAEGTSGVLCIYEGDFPDGGPQFVNVPFDKILKIAPLKDLD